MAPGSCDRRAFEKEIAKAASVALEVNPEATKHIHLNGPFPADPAAVEWMTAKGRMHEVTLQPLREAGFRTFGFTSPAEAPGGVELGPSPASGNLGAFVYCMNNGATIFYRRNVLRCAFDMTALTSATSPFTVHSW